MDKIPSLDSLLDYGDEYKYPDLKPNCIILPIVELLNVDEATINKINKSND